ncbi:MAG: hypothetical protein CM15mP129_06140 [Chloroflexota bacterium]|nr:MAG: hypothetical protein CM15mP129_06140 [Chloroflexota bacterium]
MKIESKRPYSNYKGVSKGDFDLIRVLFLVKRELDFWGINMNQETITFGRCF